MKNRIFNFHSDAGHGWLAVKLTDLIDLGINKKISRYSYIKGETVYLEEDLDLSVFFKAFEDKHGVKPTIKDLDHQYDRSPIRSFNNYRGV